MLKNWEQIKASERAAAQDGKDRTSQSPGPTTPGILTDVPRSFPAVLEAYQLTRRASRIGFDWPDISGILDKLEEVPEDLRIRLEEEVGDLLFAGVNIARFLGIDPEIALKKANRKFRERFEHMEEAASAEGKQFADLSRDRKEEMWNRSKMVERGKRSRAKKTAKVGNTR